MSEKPSTQAPPATMYPAYAQTRLPYNNPGYHQYHTPGLSLPASNPLGSMHNLKATLPGGVQGSNSNDLGGVGRPNYTNNPTMVLPSGQVVPLSAFYGQGHNSTEPMSQLPYLPTGMFPSFVGSTSLNTGIIPNYNWQYGLAGDASGLDPARRGSSSTNEENYPLTPAGAGSGQQDFYAGYPYMATTSAAVGQQYIAGPIQPMKCADNKSYEMVNLDELTQRDPPMPRAVPALWTNQEELSLAKCLQNPEGITNIYIRGFMPDTTDDDLHAWASRFGEIESCKAIVEQDTGKCKGFGFVLYYSPACAENCIRGFFHLGFQASYAQKSRNSRLKDLEDRSSTNIYCTGVPIDWNEADLCKHFLPYHAVSTKICRDAPSGVSKEVGFARFEDRETAERVIKDFHSMTAEHDGVKLYLRFADTKAQKQLKQQSQERRTWRSREYNYSVEHTPSPTLTRLQSISGHLSPHSHASYQSPAGTAFTPATSVSPPEIPGASKPAPALPVRTVNGSAWPIQGGLPSISNAPVNRPQVALAPTRNAFADVPPKTVAAVPIVVENRDSSGKTQTPSPKKITVKISPASGKENVAVGTQATT